MTFEQEEMYLVQLMYLGYPVLTFEEWIGTYWKSDYESEYSERYLGSLTFGEYHELQKEDYQNWLNGVMESPEDWRNTNERSN